MSDCIDDMAAYTHLTDHVFYQILYSTDDKLQSAREILEKIQRRELYKYVDQAHPQVTCNKRKKTKMTLEKSKLQQPFLKFVQNHNLLFLSFFMLMLWNVLALRIPARPPPVLVAPSAYVSHVVMGCALSTIASLIFDAKF